MERGRVTGLRGIRKGEEGRWEWGEGGGFFLVGGEKRCGEEGGRWGLFSRGKGWGEEGGSRPHTYIYICVCMYICVYIYINVYFSLCFSSPEMFI